MVVGSLASSVHGQPRTTNDVDLVALLDVFDTDVLMRGLLPMGYVDADAVLAAIEQGRSFNFIDDATGQKVDVFCTSSEQARDEVRRARLITFAPDVIVPILSPEDIVVQKLRWYERGGRVSDRQWRDLVEVLRIQGPAIDSLLLERLAAELRVDALLVTARQAARS